MESQSRRVTAPAVERVRQNFAAASVLAVPFAVTLLGVRVATAPSDAQWRSADPLLRILPRDLALWLVPAFGLAAAVAWVRRERPPRRALLRALAEAAVGVVMAGVIVGGLRLAWGPRIPAFVPAEESPAPGFLLNVAAGYAEEALFRLSLLPLLFLALAARVGRGAAAAIAIVGTGLAFALIHEPASAEWSTKLFLARFLLPGFLMSAASLFRSPSFIVVAHCAAHTLIPFAFARGQ